MQTNKLPENSTYIRNGFGQQFRVHYQEESVILQNYHTGKLTQLSLRVFTQLWKNRNYDTVINPNSIRESLDTKAIASRFLIKE
jgi:hypothetical protein